MQAFDFQDVTLNPGRWKDALDETMNFYLNIPNDNIMKYMRESVGRPAPGIYYTGWYPQSKGIALIGQWPLPERKPFVKKHSFWQMISGTVTRNPWKRSLFSLRDPIIILKS